MCFYKKCVWKRLRIHKQDDDYFSYAFETKSFPFLIKRNWKQVFELCPSTLVFNWLTVYQSWKTHLVMCCCPDLHMYVLIILLSSLFHKCFRGIQAQPQTWCCPHTAHGSVWCYAALSQTSFQTQRLSFTTCVCMPQQNWRVLVFFMCSSVKMIPVLFCHFQEIHIFLLVAGEVALHFESRASEFPLSTVCIQCSLVCVSSSVTFSFFFFIMCLVFF